MEIKSLQERLIKINKDINLYIEETYFKLKSNINSEYEYQTVFNQIESKLELFFVECALIKNSISKFDLSQIVNLIVSNKKNQSMLKDLQYIEKEVCFIEKKLHLLLQHIYKSNIKLIECLKIYDYTKLSQS